MSPFKTPAELVGVARAGTFQRIVQPRQLACLPLQLCLRFL